MKIELERQIMDNLFMAHLVTGQEYFRHNEIGYLSKVKISTLEGILPRLEKRKWIMKYVPNGRAFHFTTKEETKKETYKEFSNISGFPSDIIEQFKSKLKESEEKSREHKIPKLELEKKLRKGRITHRKKILNQVLKDKNVTLYKIIEYPFLYNSTKESQTKIKEGTKRYWMNSAKDFSEFRNKFFKDDIIRAGSVDAILKKYAPRRRKSHHKSHVCII